MSTARRRARIALNIDLLNDAQRAALLGGITKVAPTCPLMANPSVAASYDALTAKGATLAADVTAVAQNEKLYKASLSARNLSRLAFDLELDTLRTLVENNGTNEADVTGMGFTALDAVVASRLEQPDAPTHIDIKPSRVHGKVTVAVHGQGYLGTFAAQLALDPLGPSPAWIELPGRGKSRKITGYASGTKVWVRFAQVRYGMQSAWSVAVLVSIP